MKEPAMSERAAVESLPEFRQKSGVYALVDPRSGRVMYCGQSLDVDYRYRQHVEGNGYAGNPEKARWIAGLRAQGLAPKLVILAECDWPESDDVEKQFIRNFKVNGQCELNKAAGGQQNRGVSKLANSHKDDWFQLGRKVKAARELMFEIVQDVGKVGGPKAASYAIEVMQSFDRFKARMETMLVRAFPEWRDISRVFYGPTDPRE
jgi:hypothetical protein